MKQTIRIKSFTDKIEKLTYIDGKSLIGMTFALLKKFL